VILTVSSRSTSIFFFCFAIWLLQCMDESAGPANRRYEDFMHKFCHYVPPLSPYEQNSARSFLNIKRGKAALPGHAVVQRTTVNTTAPGRSSFGDRSNSAQDAQFRARRVVGARKPDGPPLYCLPQVFLVSPLLNGVQCQLNASARSHLLRWSWARNYTLHRWGRDISTRSFVRNVLQYCTMDQTIKI